MLGKSYPYLLALVVVLACGGKSTIEDAVQKIDSVETPGSGVQHVKFLNLDMEQYQVYQEGDTAINLPQTDLFGVPRDREIANLEKTSGVTREGDRLTFTLKNGEQKVLTSDLNSEENTVEYIFMRSLDDIGYWEVLVFYYESFEYLLVNQSNGKEAHLWNKPVLSPDYRFLLVGSLDIEAGFIPNGFQLWSVEKDSLMLQWEKQLENWGAEKLIWTNDDYIWGEQMYRDQVSGELKARLIKMRMFWSEGK